MARRARKGSAQTAWAVAAIVAAALLLVWWLSARRAEAPGLPASQPGARALSEVPGPLGAHEGGHGEITDDEKQDLERILRERGGATPGG
jgi:hypothetical protein